MEYHLERCDEQAKMYNCESCEYKVSDKSIFNNHIKHKHGKGSLNKCSKCEFEAPTPYKLKVHEADKHGEIVNCPNCSYKSIERNVNRHLANCGPNVEMLDCEQCDYKVWKKRAKRAKPAFQGERSEPWKPLQPILLIHSFPTTLKNRKSVHKHQRNESAQVAWISFFQSVKRKTFFARFARFARKFCFAQTFSGCFLMVWKKKFGRIEWKMSEQLQISAFDKRKEENGTSTMLSTTTAEGSAGGVGHRHRSSGKPKIFVCKAILAFFFSLTIRKKFPDVWHNQNLANWFN